MALVFSDVLALAISVSVALNLVHQAGRGTHHDKIVANLMLTLPLYLAVIVSLSVNGLYPKSAGRVLRSSFTEMHDVVYGLGIAGCVVLGIDHLMGFYEKRATLEPVTIVVALLIAAVLIPTARVISRKLLLAARVEQFRVLVVGSGMTARNLLRDLSWDSRITVVGCVDDDPAPGTAVLGSLADLPRLVEEHSVDQVLVGFSRTHPSDTIAQLQALGSRVSVSVVPRYYELLTWRSAIKDIAGLALIDVAPACLGLGARFCKRACDLFIASLVLLLTAPVLAAVAIVIKATSPGPVLFRQQRIGRGRKPFTIYKLRTMHADAERQQPLLDGANEMDGPMFKIRSDPRSTPLGHLLRRSSLDELPQLFNVIKGDMSLVGPRPFVPKESEALDGAAERRFEVRPGMTGLWQVSGKNDLTFDELRRLDYLYVASWSIWWDLRILLVTPARVLRNGAF